MGILAPRRATKFFLKTPSLALENIKLFYSKTRVLHHYLHNPDKLKKNDERFRSSFIDKKQWDAYVKHTKSEYFQI